MRTKDKVGDEIVALVIDDRKSSLETRTRLLEAHGFEVIGTDSIETAIREFKTKSLDIVVTDICLDPDEPREKGGIEIARRIRELNKKIPIVGYSAVFSENDLSSSELKVFDTYLTKGSNSPRELLQHVTNWRALANSYRALRHTRAFEHLNLFRADDPQLLYSVNTWLAYNISQRFFGGQHYVWCTPDYDAESKPSYTATVPPSSCPKEIYRLLREAVRRGDRHSDKIGANVAGILRGAELWKNAGNITVDQ